VRRALSDGSGKTVLFATPLFLAVCVIEITDLLFAFDSVPAALAVTSDTYVVITANIFAILGLRAMFFAMQSVLHRFAYMKYALSVLLVFIGLKVFYDHLFGKIMPEISLSLTLLILVSGVVISILRTKNVEK
jgi:tellurite resistance protein TerC